MLESDVIQIDKQPVRVKSFKTGKDAASFWHRRKPTVLENKLLSLIAVNL